VRELPRRAVETPALRLPRCCGCQRRLQLDRRQVDPNQSTSRRRDTDFRSKGVPLRDANYRVDRVGKDVGVLS